MVGFLDALFSGGAEKEAAQKDIAAAQGYQSQALPALQQGYQTGTTALNQGIGAFTPLANLGAQYSSVSPLLTNALGAGGAAGQQSALNAFQNYNPGYQFALNQAQQAAERAAGAGGMTASGNLIQAEQQNASNLANQNFNNWITQLQGTGQMGLNATNAAAQGQAAGYGSLADLAQNYGQNQANVYGNVEGATIGANNLQAAGEAAGAKNLLGAGLSLATLALGGSPFGGSLMGGSSGSAGGTGGYSLANTPIGQAFGGIKSWFS
jgi:hypothetical protein